MHATRARCGMPESLLGCRVAMSLGDPCSTACGCPRSRAGRRGRVMCRRLLRGWWGGEFQPRATPSPVLAGAAASRLIAASTAARLNTNRRPTRRAGMSPAVARCRSHPGGRRVSRASSRRPMGRGVSVMMLQSIADGVCANCVRQCDSSVILAQTARMCPCRSRTSGSICPSTCAHETHGQAGTLCCRCPFSQQL